jgi:hypothetical protein
MADEGVTSERDPVKSAVTRIQRSNYSVEPDLARSVGIRRTKCARGCEAVVEIYDDGSSLITCPVSLDCFRSSDCDLQESPVGENDASQGI